IGSIQPSEGLKNLLRILSTGRSQLPNRSIAPLVIAGNRRAIDISGAVEDRSPFRTQPVVPAARELVKDDRLPTATAVRRQLVNCSHSVASAVSCAIEVTVRVPGEPGEREATVGG